MLNAHTITRTFRETQFDICVFLETLREILDTSSSNSIRLIESKWSDGSVDLSPSVAMIDSIVDDKFPRLGLSQHTLVPTGDKDSELVGLRVFSDDSNSGLRCKIVDLEDSEKDAVFKDSRITDIVADTVTIAEDSDYNLEVGTDGFEDIASLSTTVKDSQVENLHTFGITISTDGMFDISSSYLGCPTYFNYEATTDAGYSELLKYSRYSSYVTGIRETVVLTGATCIALPTSTQLRQASEGMFKDSPVAIIKVPVVGEPSVLETLTEVSLAANGMDTQISPESDLGLLCLYPRVYGSYRLDTSRTQFHDIHTYVYGDITESENFYIVNVVNTSDTPIKACNVWHIVTGSTVTDTPSVSAVNFILIPAYSRIDFLVMVQESIPTRTRIVKMLPMKMLSEQ